MQKIPLIRIILLADFSFSVAPYCNQKVCSVLYYKIIPQLNDSLNPPSIQ